MDIATHTMAGIVLASPFVSAAPIGAACFVLGSALPDLDSLSRLFGKTAFLRWHQTYTHSLPAIGLLAGAAAAACWALGVPEPWAPLALGAGMVLHSLMDLTNTYGMGWLWPFDRRRRAASFVFFIDAPVLAASALACGPAVRSFLRPGSGGWGAAAAYAGFLAAYWPIRWAICRRARRRQPPGTVSLVPSALVPWRFYGLARRGDEAITYELNALTGAVRNEQRRETLDRTYAERLARLDEYRQMRDLSAGYCVVEARRHDGELTLTCRDLRTRNFGGTFGALDVTFDGDGNVTKKVFHV